jgi:hypothetical protein
MPYPAPRQIIEAERRVTSFKIEKKDILPYSILIGLPPDVEASRLRGSIQIKDTLGNKYDKSFDLNPAKDSSWLQTVDRAGYVIATTNTDPFLLEFLKRGATYELNLRLDTPRQNATIWLMTLKGVGLCFPTN